MNKKDWAKMYYNLYPDKYIFSPVLGWFEYDNFNVLCNDTKNCEPLSMINSISDVLQKYVNEQRVTGKPDDKEFIKKEKINKKAVL